MPPPVIRMFRESDAACVVALNEQACMDGFTESGFAILPLTEQQIREEIDSGVAYVVCELEGTSVAFLKYSTRTLPQYQAPVWVRDPIDYSDGIHIEKIVVRRDHRCRGIGRTLYEFLAAECPSRLLYTFVVVSPCENTASTRFHDALGFRAVAHVPYEMADSSWFQERLYILESPACC